MWLLAVSGWSFAAVEDASALKGISVGRVKRRDRDLRQKIKLVRVNRILFLNGKAIRAC